MSERLLRTRIIDQRPPSRHMRSLLRQGLSGVYRALRDLEYRTRLVPDDLTELRQVFDLCRRATAREPHPAWLAAAAEATPPTVADAVAALTLLQLTLAAIDVAWRKRLTAAGLDPKWPGDDA